MPKYYNNIKGYYKVQGRTIYADSYYILSLSNLRKPVLLRLACSTSYLAKRYIMLKVDPILHEVITGYQAIERNIPMSERPLRIDRQVSKYDYPRYLTVKKRKVYRTNFRKKLRNFFKHTLSLKQFTIRHRGNTYTLYDYSTQRAFYYLHRTSNMSWDHFIKNVDNTPQEVTKQMFFIKSYKVSLTIINQFNLQNNVRRIKYPPTQGKISRLEIPLLSVQGKKPQRLFF